jgi:hypothetical protein
MVLADNGSPFYMSGVPDPAWNNSELNLLKSIPGSAFEAVDVSSLKVANTSYAVTGATPSPTPPVNTVRPALSGVSRDGSTLTTSSGNWSGTAPLSYAYSWRRCDAGGGACATIGGASGQTYAVVPGDVGSRLYSLVTATNAAGSASQRSALSAVVVAAPPANAGWPLLSGVARDGMSLSTSNGVWTGTPPLSFTYAWRRCDAGGGSCVVIPGASGQTYGVGAADVGSRLYSLVTATNAAGAVSQRSALSAVVAAAPPANAGWPVLSGVARDGMVLTTSSGAWTGTTPLSFTYAWRRCDAAGGGCATIGGANGQTYAVVPGDVGSRLYSLVTATNAAGSASQRSALSAVVAGA